MKFNGFSRETAEILEGAVGTDEFEDTTTSDEVPVVSEQEEVIESTESDEGETGETSENVIEDQDKLDLDEDEGGEYDALESSEDGDVVDTAFDALDDKEETEPVDTPSEPEPEASDVPVESTDVEETEEEETEEEEGPTEEVLEKETEAIENFFDAIDRRIRYSREDGEEVDSVLDDSEVKKVSLSETEQHTEPDGDEPTMDGSEPAVESDNDGDEGTVDTSVVDSEPDGDVDDEELENTSTESFFDIF